MAKRSSNERGSIATKRLRIRRRPRPRARTKSGPLGQRPGQRHSARDLVSRKWRLEGEVERHAAEGVQIERRSRSPNHVHSIGTGGEDAAVSSDVDVWHERLLLLVDHLRHLHLPVDELDFSDPANHFRRGRGMKRPDGHQLAGRTASFTAPAAGTWSRRAGYSRSGARRCVRCAITAAQTLHTDATFAASASGRRQRR